MKYKIVSIHWGEVPIAYEKVTNPVKQFEEKVNKLMEDGWKPTGGIAVQKGRFTQAMIKED